MKLKRKQYFAKDKGEELWDTNVIHGTIVPLFSVRSPSGTQPNSTSVRKELVVTGVPRLTSEH